MLHTANTHILEAELNKQLLTHTIYEIHAYHGYNITCWTHFQTSLFFYLGRAIWIPNSIFR